MGAAVSVATDPDGSPVIITEIEAERLVGREMWPLYKDEFQQLPEVRSLLVTT